MHYHLCDIRPTCGKCVGYYSHYVFYLFSKLFALFVNVQYFSVALYMFNISTGVQISFVDR